MAESDVPAPAAARGGKAPTAFRTISEVAADLDVPQHVLRFWESKFPQIRPLKRGGGRRYYRPDDVALLTRIRTLLYAEGYTIKGVQRLLQEGGRSPGSRTATPPQAASDLPARGDIPGAAAPTASPPFAGETPAGRDPDVLGASGGGSGALDEDRRRVLSRLLDDLREIRADVAALA